MDGTSNSEKRMGADEASREFVHNAEGQRINTDIVMVDTLRKEYPELVLTVSPVNNSNIIGYASAGHATLTPVEDTESWSYRQYAAPARRLDGDVGGLVNNVQFGKFLSKWKNRDYIIYMINGRDGGGSFPTINNYILGTSEQANDELIIAAGRWTTSLHNEVWVFDGGYWQKSAELWQSVQKASWADVILPDEMKRNIRDDVESFFDSRATYEKLKVPWKRGIIYHGPPGNGKTISIKAMMHALYQRKAPVPTLYVRSLSSFAGPEYSLNAIFTRARAEAPCYLVFEDLDSIVNDRVRSYFLNEVDGLKRNDGILMVGSTNHLDRLDPGISKRPSRFDRKYLFPDPDFDSRVKYCKYWQSKLSDNEDIDFPDELCTAIAEITDKFSFAYIQEAFVAALLAIALLKDKEHKGGKQHKDLENLLLWREIRKQVRTLREEMDLKRSAGTYERLVYR